MSLSDNILNRIDAVVAALPEVRQKHVRAGESLASVSSCPISTGNHDTCARDVSADGSEYSYESSGSSVSAGSPERPPGRFGAHPREFCRGVCSSESSQSSVSACSCRDSGRHKRIRRRRRRRSPRRRRRRRSPRDSSRSIRIRSVPRHSGRHRKRRRCSEDIDRDRARVIPRPRPVQMTRVDSEVSVGRTRRAFAPESIFNGAAKSFARSSLLRSSMLRASKLDRAPRARTISVNISDLRFSHDEIDYLFRHQPRRFRRVSILKTATQLILGEITLDYLPQILVCRHEGNWYCRTGNRRLAAMRLALMFKPCSFDTVTVRPVPKCEKFKLAMTTNKNDTSSTRCEGLWVRVRPSGRVVGTSLSEDTFGAQYLREVTEDPRAQVMQASVPLDADKTTQPLREPLRALVGSWRDSKGSTYELRLSESGDAIGVATTRPNGDHRFTARCIRMETGDTVRVVWGQKPSYVLATELPKEPLEAIMWQALRPGCKPFEWKRYENGARHERSMR